MPRAGTAQAAIRKSSHSSGLWSQGSCPRINRVRWLSAALIQLTICHLCPPLPAPVKSLIQSTPTSVHFYRFITHCVSSWKISTLSVETHGIWQKPCYPGGTRISWEADATYSWLQQLQGLHSEAALQSYKGLWSWPVGESYPVLQICVAGFEIPASCSPRPNTSASERKNSLKANKASFKGKGEQNGFELSAGRHAKYRWKSSLSFYYVAWLAPVYVIFCVCRTPGTHCRDRDWNRHWTAYSTHGYNYHVWNSNSS